jgi:ribonuclease I
MKRTLIITTTFLLASLTLIYLKQKSLKPNLRISNTEPWEIYDYYFFALQWGATMCLKEGKTCYEKLKQIPSNELSIHGLWPSLLKGKNLEECNKGTQIVIEDNEKMNKIRKYWISLNQNTNSKFWGHEYNKHGYCYNKKKNVDVNNYLFYFNQALDIFTKNKLNVLIINALGERKGLQNISYKDLYSKIKEKLGGDYFQIICNNYNGKQYLGEIRIGFDLDFKLRKINKGSTCSQKNDIYIEFV